MNYNTPIAPRSPSPFEGDDMSWPTVQPTAPQAPTQPQDAGPSSRDKLTMAMMDAMQKKAAEESQSNPSPWTAAADAVAQMSSAYVNRDKTKPSLF